MTPWDTIVAPTTPYGHSGIANIRISGPGSLNILSKLSGGQVFSNRYATLSSLRGIDEKFIDRCLVTLFRAPESYTGEDVVEISSHGNPAIVDAFVNAICECGGRIAEPGEFTRRAFINGKMDLVQAEAVAAIIHSKSIESSQNIVNSNSSLKDKVECRLQKNPKDVFYGIISRDDIIDLSICNPPFHASAKDAQQGTRRKIKNLSGKTAKTPERNFAGISNELICDGGEYKFIHNMIRESKKYANNCYWFSTLVSKQSNLKGIYKSLGELEASKIKTIPMGTGNKSTRIVAWTFLSKKEQKVWRESRWKIVPRKHLL